MKLGSTVFLRYVSETTRNWVGNPILWGSGSSAPFCEFSFLLPDPLFFGIAGEPCLITTNFYDGEPNNDGWQMVIHLPRHGGLTGLEKKSKSLLPEATGRNNQMPTIDPWRQGDLWNVMQGGNMPSISRAEETDEPATKTFMDSQSHADSAANCWK